MSLLITVFFMEGEEPFISHVNGKCTVAVLQEIEADIQENYGDLDRGDGDYVFSASQFDGQYGEYGMCEFPPGWELSLEAFMPLQIPEEGEDE